MSTLAGRTILVVEDEPLIALELRSLLEGAGAHVFAATQLHHAMRLAEHKDVSAAILDYRMGDSDVTPLCGRLKERDVPFIFYSGFADQLDRWPDAVLVSKPSCAEAIVGAVTAVLDRDAATAQQTMHEGLPA
jgi:DNA-binding response OmpR family regulator